MKKAGKLFDLICLRSQLCDLHSKIIFLRFDMNIKTLCLGLRTCQPIHIEDEILFFDQGLCVSIQLMVVIDVLFLWILSMTTSFFTH